MARPKFLFFGLRICRGADPWRLFPCVGSVKSFILDCVVEMGRNVKYCSKYYLWHCSKFMVLVAHARSEPLNLNRTAERSPNSRYYSYNTPNSEDQPLRARERRSAYDFQDSHPRTRDIGFLPLVRLVLSVEFSFCVEDLLCVSFSFAARDCSGLRACDFVCIN
jgi:hypothetical protein